MGHRAVGDIRGRGLLVGVELVADRESRRPFARAARLTEAVVEAARERGVLLYSSTGQANGVDGDLIWERKRDGGFPEAKVLKQKVRDIVWPERDLGHSDGHKAEVPASAEHSEKLRGGVDGVPASAEHSEKLKGGAEIE